MKVGVNMLLWATHVTREHVAVLQAIKAAGADGVEIPIMEGEVAAYRELGKMLGGLGLKRTSSMAFVTPDVNPVSDDPKCRQAAVDNLKWLIECAHALGAPVICGPMYQTIGAFTGNGPTETELERAAEALRSVAVQARQAGVTLAMEPLNRFECYMLNTLADGAALTDRIGHPNVGILFDTFHANIEEKDPVGAIRRHGRVIKHVHCSANDRGIPGQDHVDWTGTFRALHGIGYDGWLVIEAFGRALPGLAAATKIWRDLFGDALDVARVGVPFVRETWERSAR
ncbi:MAG: sugar phosphate isomerase/epimerase family protein [bacterium]